jgi:hypothetical protein
MSWLFRKRKSFGPFQTNISKKGMGSSFGFLGFRFGINSNGKRFISFGIKGT